MRCKLCNAPFTGPSAGAFRICGYGQSRKNSQLCARCVESAPEGGAVVPLSILFADMRGYTSQAPDTRLEVVASDDDPRITQALGEEDYRRAIGVLDRHYNLVLVDTGTGILDSAIQGILAEADQVVVVMPPALDGARVAAMTLDWLEEHHHVDLVRGAVAVVNAVHGEGQLEIARIEEHFAARCRAVIRIPWDPVLQAGAHTALGDLRQATRDAYLELAAAVAGSFGTHHQPSHARRDGER
jgi:putative peptide zinc metalloprotease protein